MNTPIWLAVVCLAASLPTQAQTFKPIELKDQELANLRGRYVMPGRIISFGIAMSSTWQNAQGEVIGAMTSMQIQASTIKPQFYVSMIDEKGNDASSQSQVASTGNNASAGNSPVNNPGNSSVSSPATGTGTVTGGAGLNTTQGVTQVVRAAGDNNTAYNNVDLNVAKANEAPVMQPQGQVLTPGTTLVGNNGAGSLSVSSTGTGGVQLNIVANNNQGATMQRLAQGGLMQNTTLLGSSNQVRNLTSLNVVLRDSVRTGGALTGNLDQLKGLRTAGF